MIADIVLMISVQDSLQQYDQVMHCLEFARELHKQFLQINQEVQQTVEAFLYSWTYRAKQLPTPFT